jgi:hypothetical protein
MDFTTRIKVNKNVDNSEILITVNHNGVISNTITLTVHQADQLQYRILSALNRIRRHFVEDNQTKLGDL